MKRRAREYAWLASTLFWQTAAAWEDLAHTFRTRNRALMPRSEVVLIARPYEVIRDHDAHLLVVVEITTPTGALVALTVADPHDYEDDD